jgi:hypothetical protein
MSENASQWLTVSQAAARLGVSERTVQRRCKSGRLTAKLESGEEGAAWLIDGATLPTGAAIGAANVPTGADSPFESETAQSGGTLPTGAANVPTGAAIGADSVLVARLEGEVTFLRGLVEQRDRDAAELRAALREALKISTRALPAGSETVSPPQAPQRAETGTTGNQAAAVGIGSQRPAERAARPLWKVILGVR